MLHTAAVYSSASILVNLKDIIYTLTCCYDGYVRLWETSLNEERIGRRSSIVKEVLINNFERSPNKVYPTCCAISNSNQFYVGDSNGDIRIFNF